MQKGKSEALSEEEMYEVLDLNEKVWKKLFSNIEKDLK